jgi:hypothetical protein
LRGMRDSSVPDVFSSLPRRSFARRLEEQG